MKFIHIADVHLGASPEAGRAYTDGRAQEIRRTFESVIRLCEKEQTDLLLIAGDLFHRQPLMRDLKEVNYLFSALSHTRVVFIAGNHDYIRNDSYMRTFQWGENVYPLLNEKMMRIVFKDLDTAVYGLSYHKREISEPLYNEAVKKGVPDGGQKYRILLAHGGDERHIPVDWRGLEASGFDYIAMGHIHRPRAVRENRIVYAGSLEPVDRGDVGPHGFVKGEISEKGVRTEWVRYATRSYINLNIHVSASDTSGSVKEKIRRLKADYGNENIYTIILEGERDTDLIFEPQELERADDTGNIIEIVDNTHPAYDFEKIYRENKNSLIGRYIERFAGKGEDSVRYQALYEGVNVLLENRR